MKNGQKFTVSDMTEIKTLKKDYSTVVATLIYD